MKIIKCKNCSGSDLNPVPNMVGVYKCAFCGTIYQMDESIVSGQKLIQNGFFSNRRNIIIFIVIFVFLLLILGLSFLGSKPSSSQIHSQHPMETPVTAHSESSEIKKAEVVEKESPKLSAEYNFLNSFEAYGDSMYYICLYKNTSEVRIDKPKMQISYFNENDEPIDTVSGFGFKANLNPGESTGLLIISKKKYKLARSEIQHFPSEPTYIPKEVKLQISNTKLQKGDYGKYQLIGSIQNVDEVSGQFIAINGVLLNGKKAISMNSTYIHQKVFKPGEKSVFKIDFTIAGDKIATDYFIESSSRVSD